MGRTRRTGLWIVWFCGVALFPTAAFFALPDTLPFPRIFDSAHGVGLSSAWTLGFGMMGFAMFGLRSEPLRVLAIAQAIAGLAFALTYAAPSIDTYAYLGYGSLVLHGGDPWNIRPIVPYDEISQAFTIAWTATPPNCRYGPGFVLFEALVQRLFDGISVGQFVVVQRMLSLGAAVWVSLLVRGSAVRFWALNPFVSYFYVLESHNDVFFLLAMVGAIRARNPFVKGALLGLAGSVKIVALAQLAWLKPKCFLPASALALATLVVSYRIEPAALNPQGLTAQLALTANSIVWLTFNIAVAALGSRVDVGVVRLCVAGGAIAIAFFLRWSRRDAMTLVALLFVAALPVFWPWYLGWALLASIAGARRPLVRYVASLCICSFVTDLPNIGLSAYQTQVTCLFFIASLVLPIACGVVPTYLARPGDSGSLFWHARQRLAFRSGPAT